MAAKGSALDNAILSLLLNGTAIANVADNAASGPLTNLYVALHTATPGAGGSQTTNEAAYTGYARVAIARSPGSPAWTVASATASPAATIFFPPATAGSEVETFASIGTASTGAGEILYFGAIAPTISVGPGVTPFLQTGSTITES